MSLMVMENFPAVLFFLAYLIALVWAALRDAFTYIIPNEIPIFLSVLFIAAALLLPGEVLWGRHIAAGFIVLLAGYVLSSFSIIGGGDAKLLVATSLWHGIDLLPYQLLAVSFTGGILAIILLSVRVVFKLKKGNKQTYLRLLRSGEPVPYGIAIAIGSMLIAQEIPLFSGLTFLQAP